MGDCLHDLHYTYLHKVMFLWKHLRKGVSFFKRQEWTMSTKYFIDKIYTSNAWTGNETEFWNILFTKKRNRLRTTKKYFCYVGAYLFPLPLENVMKILRTREMRLCSIKKYIFLKWYAFFELMKYNETTDKSTFYRDRWVDDLKNVILSKFGSNDEMTSHSGFGL